MTPPPLSTARPVVFTPPQDTYREVRTERRVAPDYGDEPRSGSRPEPSGSSGNGSGLRKLMMFSIAITVVLLVALAFAGSGRNENASSYNREPIATGVPYDNDCIVDELGWFDDAGRASRDLQYFYDKTGIQPYIYLKAYDAGLASDEDKEAYARDWYEANIDNESTFLYVYFAEADQDGEVGYMAYVNGKQVTSVMDAEAVGIFWNYIDNFWYKDMSTDDMFAGVFRSTADKIMTKSATFYDIVLTCLKISGVVTVLLGVLLLMQTRRRHEAERSAETERILKADLGKLGDAEADDLADKYTE